MGESHVVHIIGQLMGEIPIAEPPVGFGHPHERPKMDFINGHRGVEPVFEVPLAHPFAIAPPVTRKIPHL